ncbi:hypothetical protein AALP_AA3G205700 [Arabis alpina]|uniref:DUF287 domain-containing protein n=2 Tax=Arabis alpina TaxID=50452 RepID=A0A087HAI7_ARAAL|nr:hypothetical protein AALP_AA3G205700 [Arabis alpina]
MVKTSIGPPKKMKKKSNKSIPTVDPPTVSPEPNSPEPNPPVEDKEEEEVEIDDGGSDKGEEDDGGSDEGEEDDGEEEEKEDGEKEQEDEEETEEESLEENDGGSDNGEEEEEENNGGSDKEDDGGSDKGVVEGTAHESQPTTVAMDIHSIMEPRLEEIPLMDDIMDALEDDDHYDAIVDGWMKMLDERKNIWFEKMFNDDVEGRKVETKVVTTAKGKRKVQESGGDCFKVLKDLMEAGLKELGGKVTNLELEVSEKLADLDKKVKYFMKFVPPMEKVVESGEPSSAKDKEVRTGVEKELEGGEELGGEELGDEELGGEPSTVNDKKKNVNEKNKGKKRRISYSNLVSGHFEKPNTRSRKNP